jgi:hypothetical protein
MTRTDHNQHAKEPYENNQCQWRAYEIQYHGTPLHSGCAMAYPYLIFAYRHKPYNGNL